MKKTLLITVAILAAAVQTVAQNALQTRLEQIIRQSSALEGARVGIAVKNMDGKAVAMINAGERMTPASNVKLITTGTALHALKASTTLQTGIGYTGVIVDGTLEGDVYIIGGGDPTTAAGDDIAQGIEALFSTWKNILHDAGIERINGRIIGDGRAWDGYLENSNWTWDDIGTYYGAGADALCFYKNAVDLQVAAGEAEGEPVQAVQSFPETPWMHNTNRGITGREGTGNSLYLFTTDLAPYAELRGSFAVGRSPKTEHFANKFGALTCAYYFGKYLTASGMDVSGEAADIDPAGLLRGSDFVPGEKAGEPVVLGYTQSPSIGRIARETNLNSDNFYAEALFRTLGKTLTGSTVYDSCRVATMAVLQELGLKPGTIGLDDGCGLSRKNAIPALFFADFLCAMASSPAFGPFIGSIPTPGEGTLITLLRGKACAGRYRLKSGSMEGILCYSGYLLDDFGTPLATVSLLVNGSNESATRTRRALENILSAIAEELPGRN